MKTLFGLLLALLYLPIYAQPAQVASLTIKRAIDPAPIQRTIEMVDASLLHASSLGPGTPGSKSSYRIRVAYQPSVLGLSYTLPDTTDADNWRVMRSRSDDAGLFAVAADLPFKPLR